MKTIFTLIMMFSFYSILLAQSSDSRFYFPQDSMFFKRVTISNGASWSKSANSLLQDQTMPDTARIKIEINLSSDRLTISIKDKETDTIISTYSTQGYFEQISLINKQFVASGNRFFINLGYIQMDQDTLSGWSNTRSFLDAYLLKEDYSIIPFGSLSGALKLVTEKYACGFSYFNSGGGFTQDCEIWVLYQYQETAIKAQNTYAVCFGRLINFMDGKYNTTGHLYSWRHPDVGFIYLEVTDTNLNHLYSIEWNNNNENSILPNFAPNNYTSLPINLNHNYLLVNCSSYNNTIFCIVDLKQGAIKDTLFSTTISIDSVYIGKYEELLFYSVEQQAFYILDYSKFATKTIELYQNNNINDSIGRLYQCNIWGNNLRFKSLNSYFSIDSLLGTIFLNTPYNLLPEGCFNASFLASDGYNNDTICVSFQKPLSRTNILAKKASLFPNPANNHLTISNQNQEILHVRIFTIQGNLIKEISIPALSKKQLDMSLVPEGVYIITSFLDNIILKSELLIINH